MAYKLVHYINQFFAGIGGEDKADVSPEVRDGIVGPGMAFKAAFNGEAEIVVTHDQQRRLMKLLEAVFESARKGEVIHF